jgi:hypothetical protein
MEIALGSQNPGASFVICKTVVDEQVVSAGAKDDSSRLRAKRLAEMELDHTN